MNQAQMAGRLAVRTGLSKSLAREAAEGVFGTFGTRSRLYRTLS